MAATENQIDLSGEIVRHIFQQTILYEIHSRLFSRGSLLDATRELLSSPAFLASDEIWFMGIWKRSPKSGNIAKSHPGLKEEFTRSLFDWKPRDVGGSPYAIFEYSPEPKITSKKDILELRSFLGSHGKKLVLDFVPNHMAIDTPLLDNFPECFVSRETSHGQSLSQNFFSNGKQEFAHGRDPYFDGWTDTVQWDFSNPKTLEWHQSLLLDIASFCDGVRCDMAMLPLPSVFEKTHGKRALPYWDKLIQNTKAKYPKFKFYAEAYWNMEYELQCLGFDATYDKTLTDRFHSGDYWGVRSHLNANLDFQEKSIRFIENHDETRAMTSLGEKSMDAFALMAFLPGILLFHQGQDEGLKIRWPVQLVRREAEEKNPKTKAFYDRAFHQLHRRTRPIERVFLPFDANKQVLIFGLSTKEVLIWNPDEDTASGLISIEYIEPPKDFCIDIITGISFAYSEDLKKSKKLYFEIPAKSAQWLVW